MGDWLLGKSQEIVKDGTFDEGDTYWTWVSRASFTIDSIKGEVTHTQITTDLDNDFQVGETVTVSGGYISYNGDYTVASIQTTKQVFCTETIGDIAGSNLGLVTGAVDEWVITGGEAIFTAITTNSRKLSQVLDTAVGDLYQILVTVSGISLVAANASLVVSLDAAIAGYITKNDSYTIFVRAGTTPSAGIQFYVTNDTATDTVTIDDVSCKLAVSGTTTNEAEIIVTGPLTTGEGANLNVGPNDVFIQTGTTSDGRRYWTSIETHFDAAGNPTFFYLFWLDGVWIIGPTLEVATDDRWETEATTSYSPLDFEFNPLGTFTGVATANGGPHTIERRKQASRRSRYELVG